MVLSRGEEKEIKRRTSSIGDRGVEGSIRNRENGNFGVTAPLVLTILNSITLST